MITIEELERANTPVTRGLAELLRTEAYAERHGILAHLRAYASLKLAIAVLRDAIDDVAELSPHGELEELDYICEELAHLRWLAVRMGETTDSFVPSGFVAYAEREIVFGLHGRSAACAETCAASDEADKPAIVEHRG